RVAPTIECAHEALFWEIDMSSYDTPNAAEMYLHQNILEHLYAAIGGVPPMRQRRRQPRERETPPVRAAKGIATRGPTLLERLDAWFWRQEQKEREAYLARSTDVFDLERRIDAIERGVVTHDG